MSFETWTVAECPLRIEYAVEAVREVRRIALSRMGPIGSKGVGGVLYGRLEGETLRIIRVRTVPPGADERAWARLAASVPSGLTAAGLFAVRDEVSISNVELDLLRRQFPAPWQVALVMTRDGKAGFFARDHDGTLDPNHCRAEFTVTETTALAPLPFGNPRGSRFASSRPVTASLSARAGLRLTLAAWALSGIVALAAGYGLAGMNSPKTLQLGVTERGDRLVIYWERSAALAAGSGIIEILDGPDRLTRTIQSDELASGKWMYAPRTGDVAVRMHTGGLNETARYVGRIPETALPKEIAALLVQSTDLLSDLSDADARTRELQKTLDRLGRP